MTPNEAAALGTASAAADRGVAVEEGRSEDWDRYVNAHPGATAYHLWGWKEVLERTFGHRAHYLLARRGAEACGVLPLVLMRSLLFGRFLCSLPYLNYGGFLSSGPDAEEVERALLARAAEIARRERVRSIELRHVERRPLPEAVKSHKVTMLYDLASSEEAQWKALESTRRNRVRKATSSGFTCETNSERAIGDFYSVFARNMRDLGTPVYPIAFFENMRQTFPTNTSILVVKKDSRPVAACFLVCFRDRVETPWVSSIREYNPQSPNILLYWEAMRFAIRAGARVFDLGRSTPDEGTFRFKQQWGARPVPLHWQYWLEEGTTVPDRSPKNPKFALAIKLWQRLPLAVAGFLGPRLTRGIP